MFNAEKLRKGINLQNKDLINELLLERQDYSISICGSNELYIHVDDYNKTITIDTEMLEGEYDETPDELIEVCRLVDSKPPLDNSELVHNTIKSLEKYGYAVMEV